MDLIIPSVEVSVCLLGLSHKVQTKQASDWQRRYQGLKKHVGKFDYVSNVDESAKKGTEKRPMWDHRVKVGKFYRRSLSSIDGVNDDESDGVSKKIQSKKVRLRIFDSDFTTDDDDVGPGSKRTKEQMKTKQNSEASKTEEKCRIDSKHLRRYSQGHFKGSTNSSLKRCKVDLGNCSSKHLRDQDKCSSRHLDDQASFRGQSSCSISSSRRGNQHHDKSKLHSPKHTR